MKLPRITVPALNLRGRRFAIQFTASVVFLLLLLGHVLRLYNVEFISRLDAAIYDLKIELGMSRQLDERIVIVDIDEKSLKEVGRWPWPREQVARLTANLFQQYGVAAVGYDIIFAEPDQSSGLPILEQLARGELAGEAGFQSTLSRLRPRLDYDARFAEALGTGPSVLGYYFNFSRRPEIVGQLPPPLLSCAELKRVGVEPVAATGYNANLAQLQARAATAGFFNMQADFDGVARRMPLVIKHAGRCYGSLALLTTQQAMGATPPRIQPPRGLFPAAMDMEGLIIPMDAGGMALVPYRVPGAFEYISAADVIAARTPAAKLEGRAVLIGSTAPGILDLRSTPVSKVFPGVEIHANVMAGMLDGTIRWEPVHVHGVEAGILVVAGLLMAILLPLVAPFWAALATVLLSSALTSADFYAWQAHDISLPLATTMVGVIGLFIINMSYGFFIEARSKAQITRLFGQYVPPELVDEMAKDPARYSLRGESRVMTVLFSDIVGFTSISEGLEASQLAAMLNVFLTHMTRVIQHNRGTIDKYIGDAIMAFWGAPMSDELHARDAVLTALAMQGTLGELNSQLEAKGWPTVRIGVGVNSGRMSVGNMGSEFRMAYTVMADAVNLASRLEALTRQYGLGVLVGESTRAACPDLGFMLVDRVRVKGKAKPVAIYEPLGVTAEIGADRLKEAADFELALEHYQAQRWDEAERQLRALNGRNPRKLYDVYLERCTHFRENPPAADWDGVFTFTSK